MGTPHGSILFLSGAGLPPWIWDRIRRILDEQHDVRVAARPAHAGTSRLRDYAEAAIDSAPAGRFTLVAHSSGGVIGAEIAQLASERVSAFLAVSAVLPEPGGSFISAMPAPNRWVLDVVMRLAGTRPPDAVIRRGLTHGLDDQVAARIIADFSPESPGLFRDKTAYRSWDGWRGYVLTRRDRELSVTLQRRCAQRLGAAWQDELDTAHLPMIENPPALAGAITRFLQSVPE